MQRKVIFDTIRSVFGRGLRQAEVDRIGNALDCAEGDSAACAGMAEPMLRAGPAGLALIKRSKGCARRRTDGLVEAYPDPGTGGDLWTIGWGATSPDIGRGTLWTQEQCDDRLQADGVRHAEHVIRSLAGAPTSQAQFDALVSFHFNIRAIGRATFTQKHRAGDFTAAEREFGRWVHGGGRLIKGLVRRRKAEAALYRSGC